MTSAPHSEIQSEAHSEITPASSSGASFDTAAQLAALLTTAGTFPLNDIGWLRITGEDRVRWLNGMVTNSIQDLQPGHGNYSFVLSAQGRIQGDGYAFSEPDALLLETTIEQIPSLTAFLDRFIIMDDVELTDVSASHAGLLVAGPTASALLNRLNISTADLAPLQRKTIPWRAEEITVLQAHSSLVPRFEVWASPSAIDTLASALHEPGAAPISKPAIEHLRILEGIPRYGVDIRDKELPQRHPRPVPFTFPKAATLGQEIVERIRSRGNVHRTFTAFRLEGTLPPAGTLLEVDGKQIGELTTTAAIPLLGGPIQLALGYVRREALDRNLRLVYPGGPGHPRRLALQHRRSQLTPHGI